MSSKGHKGPRRIRRDLAARLLGPLSQDKAFHFYLGIDKPTGIYASSLLEFSQRLIEIDPESVSFHVKRGDFRNWLSETVGDEELASRIERLKDLALPSEELRSKVYNEVRARCEE
ncbi:MAG: DUF5752 family protein, partial [Candidatus Bathyarchaeia archaeon]